jgi:26S proteasome regulatory subunit N8
LTLVRDGKLPINHQVIYQLQEIIGLLPQLGGDVDLGKAFRAGVNDQSIIVYLSSIIRTVLALHDLSTFPLFNHQREILTNSRESNIKRSTGIGRC